MARDPRLYVIAETREDATRDWECARRDWEEEARELNEQRNASGCGNATRYASSRGKRRGDGAGGVWEKAIEVRRKFLERASKSWSN